MIEEKVILVDINDEPIGLMEKMAAHEQALLHRAFSVFVLNDKNEVMLQQRASLFHFIYKAPFDNGLTEHELDHVMIGYSNDDPKINLEEVESWKWMKIEAIKNDMEIHPEIYTVWFKIIFDKFYHYLESHKI